LFLNFYEKFYFHFDFSIWFFILILLGSLDHLLKGSKGIFIHTRLVVSYNIVDLLVFEFLRKILFSIYFYRIFRSSSYRFKGYIYSYSPFTVSYNIVFIFGFSIYFYRIFRSSLDHLWRVFIGYIHARLVVFSYNIVFIVYLLVFIFTKILFSFLVFQLIF